MNSLLSTTANQSIVLSEKQEKYVPLTEIVLLTVAPDWIIKDGEAVKESKIVPFRYGITLDALQQHVDFLSMILQNMKTAQEICDNTKVKMKIFTVEK